MKLVGDFEHTTYITGVVDVFRECNQCRRLRTIGNFYRREHICNWCRRNNVLHADTMGTYGSARGIVITELGYEDLRRWEREERNHSA